MTRSLLFLGTGGSLGVPVVGCACPVCTSDDPKNKRRRTSALLNVGEKSFLIDPGPDFRAQALAFGIDALDGVIITHAHYDHVAGIDELRIFPFYQKRPLPLLASEETLATIKQRYSYLFDAKKQLFSEQVLDGERGSCNFEGIDLKVTTYIQGGMKVTGLRLGNVAYISDIRTYPETIFEDLAGVETLIISALRHAPFPAHFTVEEAVAFAQRLKSKKTYFVHMAHDLDHEETNASLPEGMELTYDGLTLHF